MQVVASEWQGFYGITFRGWILTRIIPKCMLVLPQKIWTLVL